MCAARHSGFSSLIIVILIINCSNACNGQFNGIENQTKEKEEESFLHFMRRSITKHGSEKVQAAFDSLDQRNLGEVMRILIGEVDKQLVGDILEMHEHAENSNGTLLDIITRVNSGDHTVVLEVFSIDGKLIRFPWWKRLRRRVLKNVDKYLSEF